MKALEIKVEDNGVLKLPSDAHLPPRARLAVLILEPSESNSAEVSSALISALAEQSGAFDLLKEEPEIYSDRDILPGRENPRFRE